MRYFKDTADGFYSVADSVQPSPEWVEIEESEWLAKNPAAQPDPKDAIRAEILQIEAQQVRETARMERERL